MAELDLVVGVLHRAPTPRPPHSVGRNRPGNNLSSLISRLRAAIRNAADQLHDPAAGDRAGVDSGRADRAGRR
jgi:hypothetical protein